MSKSKIAGPEGQVPEAMWTPAFLRKVAATYRGVEGARTPAHRRRVVARELGLRRTAEQAIRKAGLDPFAHPDQDAA
jgi:hypothetical protein